MTKQVNSLEAVKVAYKAIDDKMGININVIDISEVSAIADYFVIASANNSSQLKAMADEVDEKLYKVGYKMKHSEGFQTKSWILLDFGDIVVHLFNHEDRDFYNIERLWGDAKFLTKEELEA